MVKIYQSPDEKNRKIREYFLYIVFTMLVQICRYAFLFWIPSTYSETNQVFTKLCNIN
jgi:hypothetical protein